MGLTAWIYGSVTVRISELGVIAQSRCGMRLTAMLELMGADVSVCRPLLFPWQEDVIFRLGCFSGAKAKLQQFAMLRGSEFQSEVKLLKLVKKRAADDERVCSFSMEVYRRQLKAIEVALGVVLCLTPHSPRAGYAAMVSYLDYGVGLVMNKVRSMGLEKDTLVIFTSDNGSLLRPIVNKAENPPSLVTRSVIGVILTAAESLSLLVADKLNIDRLLYFGSFDRGTPITLYSMSPSST